MLENALSYFLKKSEKNRRNVEGSDPKPLLASGGCQTPKMLLPSFVPIALELHLILE